MQNPEFTHEELDVTKSYNTPERVQDFLNQLDYNFEEKGDLFSKLSRILHQGGE